MSLGPIKANHGRPSYCDIADMDEFVDLIRRVQTPHYEEARRRFANVDLLEDFADSNEISPYTQAGLKAIVAQYK